MPDRLIVIRQSSPLRTITDADALSVIPEEVRGISTEMVEVDMRPFRNDTENGYWDAAQGYIIDRAQRVRAMADGAEDPLLICLGLADVPHVIALGAHIGDEQFIHVHDYDRDRDRWNWPNTNQTITAFVSGEPTDLVDAVGDAVVRVAISYDVSDSNVDEVAPYGRLADVTVRLRNPRPNALRSPADLLAIRQAFRDAFSKVLELRPRLDRIHLFVAAPVSVCFVVGQELRLRSGVPVVTYQYRSGTDGPNHREAITLTPGEAAAAARPLTDEERAVAQDVRTGAWPTAVRQVIRYAGTRKEDVAGEAERWYSPLLFGDKLRASDPFRSLPPLWSVVDGRMTVSEEPHVSTEPYALPKEGWAWQLTDGLLLSQQRAALNGKGEVVGSRLNRLVRLFLFHESLHNHHALTKYTAEAVGRFANCLEWIDYMADLYAALHELDYVTRNDHDRDLSSDEARHEELKQILDDVLRSHWAFVDEAPARRWQVRHLRRFLNWYWRRVQVVRAPSLEVALRVLSEPPVIEIAGLVHSLGGRRIFVHLDQKDPTTDLSLGLVGENAQLIRVVDSVNANLRELARAFAEHDHEAIKSFFQTVFEEADQAGGALPAPL